MIKEKLEITELAIKMIRELTLIIIIIVFMVWAGPLLYDKIKDYDIKPTSVDIGVFKADLIEKINLNDKQKGDADSSIAGVQSASAYYITTDEPGWIYVGTFRDGRYVEKYDFNVNNIPKVGDTIISKFNISKRSSKPFKNEKGEWWKGSVIGLVSVGDKLKVIEVEDDIPAKGGGIRIWIKIIRVK
jgi:hypothetical protein